MKKIVFYIEQRLSEGDSLRSIARALGFSPSTISREIKRHTPIDFKGSLLSPAYFSLRTRKTS
ncbi:helix-turn-helix domain-containing protein [Piscirickettsia salmonis]|uniref:helix-turn-helix domain-containing protein n=1 Tax=Piscirickettsia salmonis TaxID=1238 RepID=UPI000AED4B8D|nr:helix-turn-helix domain-containing protein [Piscirickettsia salmonis]